MPTKSTKGHNGKTDDKKKKSNAGRPKGSKEWKEDWKEYLLEQIAEGKATKVVLSEPKMPTYATVLNYLQSDPEFFDLYARAKAESADADADEIKAIVHGLLHGDVDEKKARVAIDALKWSAAKRKPRVYGEKQTLDIEMKIEHKDDRELIADVERSGGALGIDTKALLADIKVIESK